MNFTLPSMSPKAKWASLNPLLPEKFEYFRRIRQYLESDSEALKDGKVMLTPSNADEKYIEIYAIYKDFKLVLIVNENTGNESWTMVLPK